MSTVWDSSTISGNHKTIGGTGISSILGMNPWKDAHSLWLELTDRVSPSPDNEIFARGRTFEPVVAAMFGAAHPEYSVENNLERTEGTCLIRDPEHEFLTGQPDRILFAQDAVAAGWEGKTSNIHNRAEWGEKGTDSVPGQYLLQCQHYMGLTKLDTWYLSCLFLDENTPVTYREYVIRYDDELFQTMRVQAVAWWDKHIVNGIEPEIKFVDRTLDRYVQERFRENTRPLEQATNTERDLIRDCFIARQKAEAAQNEYEAAQVRLKAAIGDRDGLFCDYGKVTWKKSRDTTRTDWKAVIEQIGAPQEIIERNTKTQPGSRRFLLTAAKGE